MLLIYVVAFYKHLCLFIMFVIYIYGVNTGWLLMNDMHYERSSRPGSDLPSVEVDVYVWCYALLVVHARKEENDKIHIMGTLQS